MNNEEMIEKLREARKLIWEVQDEIMARSGDSMVSYCNDYISIDIDNIQDGEYGK